jgi:hypothetical protein
MIRAASQHSNEIPPDIVIGSYRVDATGKCISLRLL